MAPFADGRCLQAPPPLQTSTHAPDTNPNQNPRQTVLATETYPSELLTGTNPGHSCQCANFDCDASTCMTAAGSTGCSCADGGWGAATFKPCSPQEASCAGYGARSDGKGRTAPSSIFSGGVVCSNSAALANPCAAPVHAACA